MLTTTAVYDKQYTHYIINRKKDTHTFTKTKALVYEYSYIGAFLFVSK